MDDRDLSQSASFACLLLFLTHCGNLVNHRIQVLGDMLIPESDGGYSTGQKHRLTMSIVLHHLQVIVNAAINLNNDL